MTLRKKLEVKIENGDPIGEELLNEIEEFESLVTQMRTQQKRYFSTKSRQALSDSKKFEKLVDQRLEDRGNFEQTSLF